MYRKIVKKESISQAEKIAKSKPINMIRPHPNEMKLARKSSLPDPTSSISTELVIPAKYTCPEDNQYVKEFELQKKDHAET